LLPAAFPEFFKPSRLVILETKKKGCILKYNFYILDLIILEAKKGVQEATTQSNGG